MGEFEVLEHTADVGLVVRGRTLRDLFETAAEGMFAFLVDPTTVENRAWRMRRVDAEDVAGLLVAWLNDLLLLLNAEAFVPKVFVVDEISPTRVRATVHGEPVDPGRHRFRLDVKAATYHGLEVRETPEGWTAKVIFDV